MIGQMGFKSNVFGAFVRKKLIFSPIGCTNELLNTDIIQNLLFIIHSISISVNHLKNKFCKFTGQSRPIKIAIYMVDKFV